LKVSYMKKSWSLISKIEGWNCKKFILKNPI
jgi:hypothetical protein